MYVNILKQKVLYVFLFMQVLNLKIILNINQIKITLFIIFNNFKHTFDKIL